MTNEARILRVLHEGAATNFHLRYLYRRADEICPGVAAKDETIRGTVNAMVKKGLLIRLGGGEYRTAG